jgi:hypothetical protein
MKLCAQAWKQLPVVGHEAMTLATPPKKSPLACATAFFTPGAEPLALGVPVLTRANDGGADEPSAMFLIRFTSLAEATSASEGPIMLGFTHDTTIFSGSTFFFPYAFARLADVLPAASAFLFFKASV